MVYVSWNDAQAFVQWLNEQVEATRYRLPTEAEWEYAVRAGTVGDHAGELDAMGWYLSNSDNQTHPVGRTDQNAFGLYDMHGNVWEWVEDLYGADYYQNSPTTDPPGPTTGSDRVIRGGSWSSGGGRARLADRYGIPPGDRDYGLGFRLVRMAL